MVCAFEVRDGRSVTITQVCACGLFLRKHKLLLVLLDAMFGGKILQLVKVDPNVTSAIRPLSELIEIL